MDASYTDEDHTARMAEVEKHRLHAMNLGQLCMSWAALDRVIDDLFEPLLDCSAAQVASIVTNVDNISARCDILKRFLHLEPVGDEFREWLVAVLNRVSNELAPLRNRYIHDHWSVKLDAIVRTDKRAVREPGARYATPKEYFEARARRQPLVGYMFD